MQGPIAAAMRARTAPSASIAAIVASSTPATAPRQPAWAAAITPASASASSTGAQSAVTMPSARPGRSVAIASARGPAPGGHGSDTRTASAPCTWVSPTRRAGSVPSARAARARFASTASRASWLDRLQLSEANGPVETPPWRVKKAWGSGRSGERSGASDRMRAGERVAARAGSSAFREAWRCRGSGRGQREGLEQPAHAVGLDKPAGGVDQRQRLGGRLGAREPVGALHQAEPGEEHALRDRPIYRRAGGAGGAREGGEIDMGGEVGAAGFRKRVGGTAGPDRLEAVADR